MNKSVRYLRCSLLNLLDSHSSKSNVLSSRTLLTRQYLVKSCTVLKSSQRSKYGCSHAAGVISFIAILEYLGLSNEKHSRVKELLSRAKELLQNGNQKEASILYNEALTIAVNSQFTEDIYYIKKKLAVIAFNSKEYLHAEKLFLEVRDYHSQNNVPDNDIRMLYIDLRLAEIYAYMQNYQKAEERYKICAKNIKPLLSNPDIDKELIEFWLLFLVSRAHYQLNRGSFEKAYKYFAKAYETCLRTKGEMNEQTITLLQQLGSVCYQKGDLENAVMYLRKATALGKHFPGYAELANAYVSLGNILLKQGLVEEAKHLCNEGLKNAVRHKYEEGIKESNACLAEVMEATS